MLSGETASGKYPVEAVLMMRHISQITEREFPFAAWRRERHQNVRGLTNVTQAISSACCDVAELVGAHAIVSATMSGETARQIAKHRPRTPVMAVSPLAQTQRRLALVWGVECLLVPNFDNTDEMMNQTVEAVTRSGLVKGDRIVITAGVPFGSSGHTNLIQVHELE
jgi:pyruvate kinase